MSLVLIKLPQFKNWAITYFRQIISNNRHNYLDYFLFFYIIMQVNTLKSSKDMYNIKIVNNYYNFVK